MTIDIISSLACQFSCPEYLLSQYIEYHKKRLFLIARFWLKFTLFVCDFLEKERIWWCSKYIFQFFFVGKEGEM